MFQLSGSKILLLSISSAKMKNLQMGKKKFNMDPKKGIEYLIQVKPNDRMVTINVTEGFKLRVRGGLLVALSYAIDFHLLVPIQSCSQFKK